MDSSFKGSDYFDEIKERRERKFSPFTFFFTILKLIGGKNFDGYSVALQQAWQTCGLKTQQAPVKSSLSKFRRFIKSDFFLNILAEQRAVNAAEAPTFRGYRVYAVDGDQWSLPASQDILSEGFRGYPCKDNKETHYPRMYVVQKIDCISGVSIDFKYSTTNREVELARDMAIDTEAKSITLYDRLHFSSQLSTAHKSSESFFVCRCRQGDHGTAKEVEAFAQSVQKEALVEISGVLIRLIKIKHPKNKKNILVFGTNLISREFSAQDIALLYARRWEVETHFRHYTCHMRAEQWHSKNLNGILQEIYISLWLMNVTAAQILHQTPKLRNLLALRYKKANFKATVQKILDTIHLLVAGRIRTFYLQLRHFIKQSIERRSRFKSKPRLRKSQEKTYVSASLVPRRA